MQAQDILLRAARARGYDATDRSQELGQSVLQLQRGDRSCWIIDGHINSGSDLTHSLLARHKHSFKTLVAPLGIPVPEGILLDVADFDGGAESSVAWLRASQFMQRGRSYLVKPAYLGQGKAIATVGTFEELADHVESWSDTFQSFVVEEKLSGESLDLLVLQGRILAARQMGSLYLTGDGQHSLEELIEAHNAQHDQRFTIEINAAVRQLLRAQQAYLGEVVPAGNRVLLSQDAPSQADQGLLDSLHPGLHTWAAAIAKQFDLPMIQLGLLVGDLATMPAIHARVIKCDPNPEWLAFAQDETAALALADALVAALLA